MKVREAVELLQKFNPELELFVSTEDETCDKVKMFSETHLDSDDEQQDPCEICDQKIWESCQSYGPECQLKECYEEYQESINGILIEPECC
jgi:hypothetical protein